MYPEAAPGTGGGVAGSRVACELQWVAARLTTNIDWREIGQKCSSPGVYGTSDRSS